MPDPQRNEPRDPADVRRELERTDDPWKMLTLIKQLPPDEQPPAPAGATCNVCGRGLAAPMIKLYSTLIYVKLVCVGVPPHLVDHVVVTIRP